MRMRSLAALCGLVVLAGCSSVDLKKAPVEDRSTVVPEVLAPVESSDAHSVPVPTEGSFQPRNLVQEPVPQASDRTHEVVRGDTIYNISMRYGVNPRELMVLNGVEDPTQLSLGRVLQIPVSRDDGSRRSAVTAAAPAQSSTPAATVTEGEAISVAPAAAPTVEVAQRPETPQQVAERKAAEQQQRTEAAARGDIEIRWPVDGEVIADFNRTGTLGIDIAADKGDSVMVVLDGTVHYIGNNNDGYGQFVLVRHNIRLPGKPNAPIVTVYGNLGKVLVRPNETVRAGQKIAEVGSSGGLDKLRFELRQGGQPLDPMIYLQKK